MSRFTFEDAANGNVPEAQLTVYDGNHEPLVLGAQQQLGRAGAGGSVYEIPKAPDFCVKLFKPQDLANPTKRKHIVSGLEAMLEMIMREEPRLFQYTPAGYRSPGEEIKADPFVIRDAESEPNGMILANDRYLREARENRELFGWTQDHPERLIKGAIGNGGCVRLGYHAEVTIPVVEDAHFYIH